MMFKYMFLAWITGAACRKVRRLGTYTTDVYNMSVSGFSSGAYMATQVHVSFSQHMKGAGVFAGAPYMCYPNCNMEMDLDESWRLTASFAESGLVDEVIHLVDDRVFVWHGNLDTVVNPGLAPLVAEYYWPYLVNWTEQTTIVTKDASHSMVTSHYGNYCQEHEYPYIINCDYKGAYKMLDFIYGDIQEPSEYGQQLPGDFYEFDQTEFYTGRGSGSMDEVGFMYVPTACIDGLIQCRVHVVYHGCLMGRYFLGDEYAVNTGYNEVAELNNIIMLYPQATSDLPGNFQGCWDFWGHNPGNYATKCGHQKITLCKMLERVTGQNGICKDC